MSITGTMGGIDYPGSAMEGQEGVGAKTMESANPYTYSDSASQVKTNVKALSFTYPNGTAMKMENMSEPFTIWLDGKFFMKLRSFLASAWLTLKKYTNINKC